MRTKRFIIVNIFVLAMSLTLSSCLCHPFESRFMLMQEKVDSMVGISNTILQLSQDKGILLDSMTSGDMLNGVFDHHKEARQRIVRLVGAMQPTPQLLVCIFNITSKGFECQISESFLVVYDSSGAVSDALYLGINTSKPLCLPFNLTSKRQIPTEDIQLSKWRFENNKNFVLTVFEDNVWLDKYKETCIDAYYHTFQYSLDEAGHIVMQKKESVKPYRYNYSDSTIGNKLNLNHKLFRLRFTPYSMDYMAQLEKLQDKYNEPIEIGWFYSRNTSSFLYWLYCHPKSSLWKSFEEFSTDGSYYGYSKQEAIKWILEDINNLSLEKIEEHYWKQIPVEKVKQYLKKRLTTVIHSNRR